MEDNEIYKFIRCNGSKLPKAKLPALKHRLLEADIEHTAINDVALKDPLASLLLAILTGGLGLDRFYIGDSGLGICKLLTGGGCGIWWFIDIFLITGATKRHNYEELLSSYFCNRGI